MANVMEGIPRSASTSSGSLPLLRSMRPTAWVFFRVCRPPSAVCRPPCAYRSRTA